MNRPCADRIIDAEVFEKIDAPHDDDARADSEQEGAFRIDPIAGTGDRDEAGEEGGLMDCKVGRNLKDYGPFLVTND